MTENEILHKLGCPNEDFYVSMDDMTPEDVIDLYNPTTISILINVPIKSSKDVESNSESENNSNDARKNNVEDKHSGDSEEFEDSSTDYDSILVNTEEEFNEFDDYRNEILMRSPDNINNSENRWRFVDMNFTTTELEEELREELNSRLEHEYNNLIRIERPPPPPPPLPNRLLPNQQLSNQSLESHTQAIHEDHEGNMGLDDVNLVHPQPTINSVIHTMFNRHAIYPTHKRYKKDNKKLKLTNIEKKMYVDGKFYYNDNGTPSLSDIIPNVCVDDLKDKYNTIKELDLIGVYLMTGRICNGIRALPVLSECKNIINKSQNMNTLKGNIKNRLMNIHSTNTDSESILDKNLDEMIIDNFNVKICFELAHGLSQEIYEFKNMRFWISCKQKLMFILPNRYNNEVTKGLYFSLNKMHYFYCYICIDIDDGFIIRTAPPLEHISYNANPLTYKMNKLFAKYRKKHKNFDITGIRHFIANSTLFKLTQD
jgi:hypothetical protein